jgi:hypothetical protein
VSVVLKVLLLALFVAASRADGIALLVPAYFEPASGHWKELASAASRVPLIAIANVFNGPGTGAKVRADYFQAIQYVRDAGGQVIGYVYTQYGKRSIDIVKSDMLRWHQLYPLDGFFVDEMSNVPNTAILDYYAQLAAYARALNPVYQVVGNPGTNTEEAYRQRNTADILTIFENDTGYATFTPVTWTQRYPPFQFAHLMYSVTTSDTMKNYIDLASARRAGFIYITNDTAPNPWDTLPGYWSDELTTIESLNRAAARQTLTNLTITRIGGEKANVQASGAVGPYILETFFQGQWTPLATNLTATGTINWAITNITIPPNRIFRTRQP